MTSRFWARFAPSMPRVIAVPGLAKTLDARTARWGTGRRSGTSRPPCPEAATLRQRFVSFDSGSARFADRLPSGPRRLL